MNRQICHVNLQLTCCRVSFSSLFGSTLPLESTHWSCFFFGWQAAVFSGKALQTHSTTTCPAANSENMEWRVVGERSGAFSSWTARCFPRQIILSVYLICLVHSFLHRLTRVSIMLIYLCIPPWKLTEVQPLGTTITSATWTPTTITTSIENPQQWQPECMRSNLSGNRENTGLKLSRRPQTRLQMDDRVSLWLLDV